MLVQPDLSAAPDAALGSTSPMSKAESRSRRARPQTPGSLATADLSHTNCPCPRRRHRDLSGVTAQLPRPQRPDRPHPPRRHWRLEAPRARRRSAAGLSSAGAYSSGEPPGLTSRGGRGREEARAG